MSEHKTLESFLLRDPLDDYDITNYVRVGLANRGIVFEGMSWRETEEIVEAAIKPLRDEIIRLRTLLATRKPVQIECNCDPAYSHLCWKCGGTGFLKQ